MPPVFTAPARPRRAVAPRALAALLALSVLAPLGAGAQAIRLLERREVRADGHRLTVWAKRPATPARRSVLLLHGRTWSSLPNFDLKVPGGARVSLMDALVARGYAVYALDARGYGGTPRDASGWLTPDRAVRDVEAVLRWVAQRESASARGGRAPRPAVLGYSRGAQVALLAAQRHPDALSAVILYGFPYDVTASAPADADPAAPARVRTTAAAAGEDFQTPAATAPGVKEAYVRAATAADSIVVDWRAEREFAALDPRAVRVPVLLLHGERDPYVNAASPRALYSRLGAKLKSWTVLPGLDHVAHLERPEAFVDAVTSFLARLQ